MIAWDSAYILVLEYIWYSYSTSENICPHGNNYIAAWSCQFVYCARLIFCKDLSWGKNNAEAVEAGAQGAQLRTHFLSFWKFS